MSRLLVVVAAAFALCALCVDARFARALKAFESRADATTSALQAGSYVSATSVRRARSSLSKVKPALETCPAMACKDYLADFSCLGSKGPISAYGPLGYIGPLGDGMAGWVQIWTTFASLSFMQTDLEKMVKSVGSRSADGPLGPKGPLGPDGPLGDKPYTEFFQKAGTGATRNDFAQHLDATGLFTVLGPLGVLGALGPLGPLGPMGPMVDSKTSDGDYKDKSTGKIITEVTVKTSDGSFSRTYPLFERYSRSRFENADYSKADSSWFVSESLSVGESHDYKFHSDDDQFITVVVVPAAELDTFYLKLSDDTKVIAKSEEDSYINWIQIAAKAGQKLKATVQLKKSLQFLMHKYYLYVVGSTKYRNKPVVNISGPHIQPY